MKRFLISLSALGASLAVLSAAPSARAADAPGELYALAISIAVFDAVSLPVDIYWAVKGEKVDRAWAIAEIALGSAQSAGGVLGMAFCADDPKCFRGATFPLLAAFSAWTTAMVVHGAVTLEKPAVIGPAAPKGPSLSVAPIVGDGRSTPAGIGFVGTF